MSQPTPKKPYQDAGAWVPKRKDPQTAMLAEALAIVRDLKRRYE